MEKIQVLLMPYQGLWPLALLAVWLGYRWYQQKKIRKLLPQWLSLGAIVLDVRTNHEFQLGHAPGSLHIPLDELSHRWQEIPKNKIVIVVCASGARSGVARWKLLRLGLTDVYNLGAWTQL